jgi:uridine phosphorylase
MATVTAICQIPIGKIPPVCVVVGDPLRAKKIADLLTDAELVSANREYHTYVGSWKGVRITVCSHGIGGGGASCAFEELIQAGVTTIIRAGTAGSLDERFREGALVVATGAVRADGASDVLVPPNYPAVAHYEVVQALVEASKKYEEVTAGVGLIATVGCFYDGPIGNHNKLWQAAKVLAIEMEVSTLLVVASIRGIRAGACVNIDNYIFERELSNKYEPNREVVHQGTFRMIHVALDAAIALAKD